MYYVGRSHHFVLPAVFPAWFMALALLLLKSANSMRHGDSAEHRLLLLPLWLAAFHLIILATPLFSFPSIGSQVRRLAAGSGEFAESYEVIVELTRRYTVPGEKVGIVTMYAHNIAISAGVDNVYPFAHRGSLLLKSQVAEALSAFEKNNVGKIFGMMPPELERALLEKGFVPKPLVANGVYTLWQRKAS